MQAINFFKIISFLKYGPRYDWNAYQQGLLLGAQYIGRACTSIIVGMVVDKFGFAKMLLIATLASGSLLYFLGPLAATSFGTMYATRFLWGIVGVSYHITT